MTIFLCVFVFEWGKTLKEVKPGLFLASNRILKESQEKQQLIKGAKCSSHCSAADVGVFTTDESKSHEPDFCWAIRAITTTARSVCHVIKFKSSSPELKFLPKMLLS